jgi:hypothetical protein
MKKLKKFYSHFLCILYIKEKVKLSIFLLFSFHTLMT